jgi:hypothetical protein
MTFRCFSVAALALAAAPWVAAAEWSLAQGAQVHPPYHGPVPAKSDVIFSSRFKRPEAVPVAQAFGTTRFEWGYSFDKPFVDSLLAVAPWYGGAVNSNGPLPSDAGWARDFDGNVIVHPMMRAWGGRLVTTTHPQTQQVLAEQIQRFMDLGARSIQVDDPLLQVASALYFGGDFNPSTQEGFKAWLAKHPDRQELAKIGLADLQGSYVDYLKAKEGVKNAQDYAARYRRFASTKYWLAYIRSTVAEQYGRMRKQLREGRPTPVAMSMNLSVLYEPSETNPYFFLAPFADYAMAETHIDDLPQMASQAATTRALGLGFVPSIRPRSTAENRAAVATLYALGGQVIVPWDVYAGNDEKGQAKRYFGTEQEFGDLYRFVRQRRQFFDGHESAAAVGIVVPVRKPAGDSLKALVKRLVDRHIPFAYVPVGGSGPVYAVDGQKAARFKLLVSAHPDGDFTGAELKALADTRVPRIAAADLKDDALEALRPFLAAPGAERLRLFARAVPEDPSRLVVHVIDEARSAPGADPTCKRRIGIRNEMLGGARVAQAQWASAGTLVDLKAEPGSREVFFDLPECPLWGLMAIRLQR